MPPGKAGLTINLRASQVTRPGGEEAGGGFECRFHEVTEITSR